MQPAGHPHSLPRPVAECPPLGLAQKQVQFDLTDDLGNAPPLPMVLASFLGEHASCPSAPSTVDPLQPPHDDGNQHHSTHVGGAQPKTSTAKPMAAI